MSPTVGVVVPAYRPDAGRLAAYVERVVRELAPEAVRIELDDPLPGTVAALDDSLATINAVSRRRGKGKAITDGFDALASDVYAFADADGSTPATSLADVIAPVLRGEVDLSTGSRRHPGAIVECHQTRLRRRLGDCFAWSARRLLPIALSDYQCGAKAITADAWDVLRDRLREPGFGWDVELLTAADAAGYRVGEVPVRWRDDARSTVSPLGTPVELAGVLARVALRHRRGATTDPRDRLLDRVGSDSGAGGGDRPAEDRRRPPTDHE